MNEIYKIEQMCGNTIVIYCTSYINPTKHLNCIENDLKETNIINGEIIFDLLLSNGNTSNRFVHANIKNSKIDRKSMKVLKK